jgi:hypothetical protein
MVSMNRLTTERRAQILRMMVEGREPRPFGIHFMHYNFVRIHQSLGITPAMAVGVTTTLWSLTDIVRVIEDWEARRAGTLLVG